MSAERTPPFSLEAEQSVVGGMFLEGAVVPVVMGIISEADFYRESNRRIYRAMVALWERQETIDTVTLMNELRERGDLDVVGGAVYLAQLLDAVPTAANIEYHARIVARYAQRRRVIEAGKQLVEMGHTTDEEDASALQASAQKLLADASPTPAGSGLVAVRDLLPAEFERVRRLEDEDPKAVSLGVKTGLVDVDAKLGELEAGDLVIVAGRPSMGKSAFAISGIGCDAAIRQRKTVAVFSVETTRERLMSRLIAAEGSVNMSLAKKRRRMQDDEYPRFIQAAGTLKQAPLFIDHTPGLTIPQMRLHCRRLVQLHGPLGLIIADYVQLMTWPGAKDPREEVTRISRGLKATAQEFGCPLVALSQLSRLVESRPDKRPMMSDLKESGALEQDADQILLLYRPEYYFGEVITQGRGAEKTEKNVAGMAEVIIGKNRDGDVGKVITRFEKEYVRFSDWKGGRAA